jgi:hypothetical protein
LSNRLRANPAYLNTPEKLLWGLTGRELIIIALGCSLGYKLWANFFFLLDDGLVGFLLRLALALFPVLCSLALAKLRPGGRYLEIWFVLWWRYRGKKQLLLWRSVQVQDKYALELSLEKLPTGDSHTEQEDESE